MLAVAKSVPDRGLGEVNLPLLILALVQMIGEKQCPNMLILKF
ncbi:hypothetical protein [Gloeocapsopsis dulcis]|nr:hypothetical protein [Gloeocapsopsis dulcis]